jgi:hypothetical protein
LLLRNNFFYEISWCFVYLGVKLTLHVSCGMEFGIVQVLGCHAGVTKDSVHILILYCVTVQIVPMIQRS